MYRDSPPRARRAMFAAAALAAFIAVPAAARKPVETKLPVVVKQLLDCRAITDSQARLACYDSQAAAIDTQIASKDLVVIDKARADEARRGLFGYSVPNFGGLFGVGGKDDITELAGVVAGFSRNATGGMVIKLEDGSVWSQVDDYEPPLNPRRGEKVTVKRGMMGAFYLEFAKQPGIKVRRIG